MNPDSTRKTGLLKGQNHLPKMAVIVIAAVSQVYSALTASPFCLGQYVIADVLSSRW